jgi:hypothetical protein
LAALNDSIEKTAALLAARLDNSRHAVLSSLQTSLQAYLELASCRERALSKTLEAERARLSALLQRGLFDRRAERLFAAQHAVLDEALDRSRTRLSEIAATDHIVARPVQLAFVLIRQ